MSPVESLLGNKEEITAEYFNTYGSPVLILHSALQSGNVSGPLKWDPRSRLGVYLGHSQAHASNVALVFNIYTGRVSQ